jgi:hypothetical protein
MSPMLLKVITDMLALPIKRAKDDGQISGVIPHLVEDGLSIPQYADDTVFFFLDHDMEQTKNNKVITLRANVWSKINLNKSEIFRYGKAKECENKCLQLFGCDAGKYPFRYLSIPMHQRKLLNCEWRKNEERFEKKLEI